jgi:hypothetical protein
LKSQILKAYPQAIFLPKDFKCFELKLVEIWSEDNWIGENDIFLELERKKNQS